MEFLTEDEKALLESFKLERIQQNSVKGKLWGIPLVANFRFDKESNLFSWVKNSINGILSDIERYDVKVGFIRITRQKNLIKIKAYTPKSLFTVSPSLETTFEATKVNPKFLELTLCENCKEIKNHSRGVCLVESVMKA